MHKTRLLGTANITKLIVKFSVPSIVSMVVVALYNLVDRFFVVQASGSLGLAGVTIVFPYVLLIIAFMMLISTGATTLISFSLSQKKIDDAEKVVGNTLIMVILVSLVVTISCFCFFEQFLRLFGASETVLPIAKQYFYIIVWGTIFMGISLGLNACMRSEGHANTSMLTMISGGVINLILAPILIFGFNMGISGAAIATVIGQAFSAFITIWFFIGGKSNIKIRMKNLVPDWKMISKISAIGSAQFFLQLGTCIVTVIYNNALAKTGGDVAVSAVGVINNIAAIIFMPISGIGQGMQPIIAYNYSAGNFNRVKKCLHQAYFFSILITTFGFLLAEVIPFVLLSAFNKSDEQFIKFASHAMRIIFMVYPIIGFQIISAEYFQATGRGLTATILSLSRQVIALIPTVIFFSLLWNIKGVLYAAPVSDLIAFMITAVYLYYERKRLNRGLNHELI